MVLTRLKGDEMGTKLTKTSVAALHKPASGYRIHWDGEIRGFGLRITASGARSFVLQDRINGKERRLTIGRFPGVTPEVARREAQKLLGQIANGGDPVAERARRKLTSITLGECFDEYVRLRRRRKDGKALKDRTKHDMLRALDEAFHDWKRRSITAISREMVKRRYAERASRSVARANVAMRYLRAVLNFAIAAYRDAEGRPVLIDNPVRVLSESSLWHGIEARKRDLGEDVLSSWVPAVLALGATPNRKAGAGKHKPRLRNGEVFRDFFLFLVLTGARRGEAQGLRKSDVDFKHGILTFLDTKNRSDHVLPLTPYLRALLERRIEASPSESEFVFTDREGRSVSNLRYAIGRVVEDSGVKFSSHDLRRTTATILERLSVPSYTVKAVLNHLPGAADVTGRYVQVKADMKLAALVKLEDFILRHAGGGRKVIELRR